MKILLILYTLIFFGSFTPNNDLIQINPCPEVNEYTMKLVKVIIKSEKYEPFRIEHDIQNLTMEDVMVLVSPNDSDVCNAIKEDGFYYPKPSDPPITMTYFKINNLYVAVVHFSDTILKIEDGWITGSSGPGWAINIYDSNFNSIDTLLIW